MFFGEFQHTIDAKGRVAIPAKFRGSLARGAVLARGIEPCLYVFPIETWEEMARKLDAAALSPAERRRMERRFFGTATDCELDAQGRIVVPTTFRQYAGLAGDATIVGASKRFEIWDRARWQAYFDDMANEDLSGIDLPF